MRFAWPAERRGVLQADSVGNHVPVIANGSVEVREEEHGMETIDLEAGELHQPPTRTIVHQPFSRISFTSLDPWRIWSTLHNELSRIAAARTARLEEEASHITLAKQKNLASSDVISSVYNQDDFDFALVLSSNDAYAFWARYLDFRDEALCYCYPENDDEQNDNDADDCSTIATNQEVAVNPDNERSATHTPPNSSGLRRRRANHAPHSSSNNSCNILSSSKLTTPSQNHTPFSSLSPNPTASMIRSSQKRTTFHQKSLFERAVDRFSPTRFSIGTPRGTSRRNITSAATAGTTTPQRETPERKDVYSTGGRLRRRWGNQDYDTNKLSTPNLTSPPILSLKSRRIGSTARKNWKVSSSGKKTSSLRTKRGLFESAERLGKRLRETMVDGSGGAGSMNENEEDNFFASPGIPRGVGA